MQNKRKLLKKLLKEALKEEDKRPLVKESLSYFFDKEHRETISNVLEKEGYKQLARQIRSEQGLVFEFYADVHVVSFLNKNEIHTCYLDESKDIYFINKKNYETGIMHWKDGGFEIKKNEKGNYVQTVKNNFIELNKVSEKPRVTTDRYWSMKALHLRPKEHYGIYVILYK